MVHFASLRTQPGSADSSFPVHTPGPWTPHQTTADWVSVNNGTGEFDPGVASVWGTFGNAMANARLIAAAPAMYDAAHFAKAAQAALDAYEADLGARLDDMHELGRIDDSSGSPSFRIRVGHIRGLAAAIAKATGQ